MSITAVLTAFRFAFLASQHPASTKCHKCLARLRRQMRATNRFRSTGCCNVMNNTCHQHMQNVMCLVEFAWQHRVQPMSMTTPNQSCNVLDHSQKSFSNIFKHKQNKILAFGSAFFLPFYPTFHLAFNLAFCLTIYLALCLTFYLAFYLAFYLEYLLTFYLAYLLEFYLTFYLAWKLT